MEAQPPRPYICTVWIGTHGNSLRINMYLPQWDEFYNSSGLNTGTKAEVLDSILGITSLGHPPDNFIIHRNVPSECDSRIRLQLIATMQTLTSAEIVSLEKSRDEEWRRSRVGM